MLIFGNALNLWTRTHEGTFRPAPPHSAMAKSNSDKAGQEMSQGFDDRLVSAARVPWPPWVHRFVWGITALLVVVFASILQLGGRQNVWDG